MKNLRHIVKAVEESIWLITPEKLSTIVGVIEAHIAGETLIPGEIRALISGESQHTEDNVPANEAKIAILPISGILSKKISMMEAMSGGESTDRLREQFDSLVEDQNVAGIVLDIHSPGGTVYGIPEFAEAIYNARSVKPVYAVANAEAASAAYWLGSAASKLYVTSSGEVGSIGVYIAHIDQSKYDEKEGVKTTLVSAGKYKVVNNPFEPLTDEGREILQTRVNDTYEKFVNAVAKYRNVSVETVNEKFGQGLLVRADKAVELGMADEIGEIKGAVDAVITMVKEDAMSKEVLAALGLEEGASVVEAIATLKAEAQNAVELAESLKKKDEEVATLNKRIEELDAVVKKLRIESLIAEAKLKGAVNETNEEFASKMASTSEELFSQWVTTRMAELPKAGALRIVPDRSKMSTERTSRAVVAEKVRDLAKEWKVSIATAYERAVKQGLVNVEE